MEKEKPQKDKDEVREKIYENILSFLEEATYIELNEIARRAYHLKMEKERAMAKNYS